MDVLKLRRIDRGILLNFIGVCVSVWMAVSVAKGDYTIIGLILLSSLALLNVKWILVIFFLCAQLIYVLPPITQLSGVQIYISDVILVVLFLKVLTTYKKIRFPKKIRLITTFFVLSCVIPLLIAAISVDETTITSQIATFARWLSSFMPILLIPQIINTEKSVQFFVKVIATSILFQVILSVFVFQQSEEVIRASDGVNGVADYAVLITLMISLVYGSIYNNHGKTWLNYLLVGILSVSLFITFTRAAMLVFLITTIVFFLKSKRFSNKILLAFGTVLLAPILVVKYWTTFQERFILDFSYAIQTGYVSGSFGERFQLLVIGVREVLQDPLFGKGWSSFRFTQTALYSEPHNYYLQIALDNGLIGLSLFLIFLFKILSLLKENNIGSLSQEMKSISFGIYLWFIGMTVWLFTNQLLPGTLSNLYFWSVIGLSLSINLINKKQADL